MEKLSKLRKENYDGEYECVKETKRQGIRV
jgi:hypothetical protein